MTSHDVEPLSTVERTGVLELRDDDAPWLRRDLDLLARLRPPGFAPLVRVTEVEGGAALTHRVPAGGVPLSSLRADGPLRVGHVLAVGTALAEALAALHGAGLAHGGVGAATVLVAPDGSVVLGGCGLAWSSASGAAPPSAADDVEAVGALLRELLGSGSAPASLVVALVRAVDPDLALRPDAATLLGLLRRCGRAEPLLDALWSSPRRPPAPADPDEARDGGSGAGSPPSTDPARLEESAPEPQAPEPPAPEPPAPEPPAPEPRALRPARGAPRRPAPSGRASRSARRRVSPGQRRLFVAVLLLAVGATGAARLLGPRAAVLDAAPSTAPVAATLAPTSAQPMPPGAPSASAAEDWARVLDALDRGRTEALAAGSPARLQEFVTGTAYAADAALARAMAAASGRLEGGGIRLEEVHELSADTTTAVLRVRDTRAAYAVVLADGRHDVPARGPRTWTVTLVREEPASPWRIAEVVDADLSPAGRR